MESDYPFPNEGVRNKIKNPFGLLQLLANNTLHIKFDLQKLSIWFIIQRLNTNLTLTSKSNNNIKLFHIFLLL